MACSACRRDYLVPADPALSTSAPPASVTTAPVPFYLTSCHHTICHVCIFATHRAPSQLGEIRSPCPACHAITPLALLVLDDPSNDLAPFFADSSDLIETARMAGQFQLETLMDQISYFKPKCRQQKQTISRLLSEVKKFKACKAENEQLRAANAALIQERHSSTSQRQQPESATTSLPALHRPPDQSREPTTSHKRRASESGIQAELQPDPNPSRARSRYSSSSSSSQRLCEASYEQLKPKRVSLTPASRSHHRLEHWTPAQSLAIEDPGLPVIEGMRASEVVRVEDRAGSRYLESRQGPIVPLSPQGSMNGRESIRQHLSSYAFTPSASRASSRHGANESTPRTARVSGSNQLVEDGRPTSLHPLDRRTDYYSDGAVADRLAMPPPPLPAPPLSWSGFNQRQSVSRERHPFVPNSESARSHAPPHRDPSFDLFEHDQTRQARGASIRSSNSDIDRDSSYPAVQIRSAARTQFRPHSAI
ncbi:SUMO ligase CST9 [Sporobolomyces koalae]|uniref:SUMO ligase CST9 n=1 Tax=Sporobolomyces koalae TaxID=500713 RepID=UPI00316F073C